MAMQYDVWSIRPSSNDAYFRAAAAIGSAGALTLLQSEVAKYGCGYQISITSNGDDSGLTFTIVGIKVGALDGQTTTETVTGPNAGVVNSTNYYSDIISISVSGTSVNNVKIGYGGNLAFPRCRIKSVYYVGAANAGTITFTSYAANSVILSIPTVGSATYAMTVYIPPEGILTTKATVDDYAVMTLSQVTNLTVFCG